MHSTVLNNQQTLLLKTLNQRLEAIPGSSKETIESAKSVLCLCAHLDTRKKQNLILDVLNLALKNQDGTDLNDQRLFTAVQITSPHMVTLMTLVASLLVDSNHSVQDDKKLLSDAQMLKLVKICNYAISLFTRRSRSQKSVIDFQTVSGLYLKLLLQITAIKNRQQDNSKNNEQTYLTSMESIQLTLEEQKEEQPTIIELFQYLIKQTLDREAPLITHAELSNLLIELVAYQDRHIINSQVAQQKQKAQLYEVMETLCMFSCQAKLQGINLQLYEKLCETIPGHYNLSVNETRDSSNSANKMEHLFTNLNGSSIFEDSLIRLVQLEIKAIAGRTQSIMVDQTASYKLVTEIIQHLQTLPNNDSQVPTIVSFSTTVLKSILSQQNAFQRTQQMQYLQSHVMTLTQRLFQSAKSLKDSSEQQNRGIFENTLKLLISQIFASQSASNFDEQGDYFTLMLDEFVKLFRRKSLKNSFLVEVTEVVFDLLNDDFKRAQLLTTKLLPSELEKNGALDQKVSMLLSLIEMRQSLLKRLAEAMIERFQETQPVAMVQFDDGEFTRILKAVNNLVRMITIDHKDIADFMRSQTGLKSDMQQNTENLLQGFQEEQTVFFLQLWMLIAVQGYYKHQDTEKRRQLAEFAALTPTIDFNQDFQLLVRNNPQKHLFLHFSDDVKEIFRQICSNESVKDNGESFIFNKTLSTQFQRQTSVKPDLLSSKKDAEHSEDDQPDSNKLVNEEHFGLGESVFLALYAFINSMSLYSDKQTQMLRYQKRCSLIESIITLYSNEKIFNWEAFLNAQEGNYNIQNQSQTYQSFSKRVDSLSRSLFNLHMIMHFSHNQTLTQDHKFVEDLIQHDFVLLLKATCHNQKKVRQQSMAFLVQLSSNFPAMLAKKQVLYTFLDILTALSAQFDDVYDSMSHPILLKISQEQIFLDPQASVRSQIQAELLSLLASMFVKAVVIGEQELYQVFELYCADLERSKERQTQEEDFGLNFFNQLRSQVDIQRFYGTYNQHFTNFHQFRLLAISQPAQFSKAIDQLMPVAFSSKHVLEITKMQHQNKIDELQKIKPFYNAQASSLRSPFNQDMSHSLVKNLEDDYGKLLTQAFKAIMKIDISFHLHFTNNIADKKHQLDQVIKFHKYLAQKSTSQEETEKLVQRRSLKLLNQDYNSVLLEQSGNLMRVFNQLIRLLSEFKPNQGRISLLQLQVIQLLSCIPFLSLTKETVQSYCLLVHKLTTSAKNPEFESALLDMLPFTTQVLLSRLQLAQTKDQKVGGKRNESKKLKLANRIKENMNRIQSDNLNEELDSSCYDFQGMQDQQLPVMLEKVKLHSSTLQNVNAAQVVECVETFLDILSDEILFQVLKTSSVALVRPIIRAFVNLLSCSECLQPQVHGYANLALKLIRMGHMIYSILQACIGKGKHKTDEEYLSKIKAELAQQLQLFALKFYRAFDGSDFKKLKYSGMIVTIQLVEDIKYLTKLNELPLPDAESCLVGFRSGARFKLQQEYRAGALMIEQIQQFILTHIRQRVLAWNFQEQMQPSFDATGSQALLTQAQAKTLVQNFPKFALKLVSVTQASPTGVSTFGSSQFKQLEQSLIEQIKQRPEKFMRLPEALDLYIRASLQETPKNNQLRVCSFWRVNNFLRLIKYLSFKFYQQEAVNQLALKPLEYADPKTVIFYLPQLFQSLRFDNSGRLREFFKRKSRQSASFAHHLLWFCKVESENEQQHGRKVPLPLPETLNKTAADLYDDLMSEKQMSQHQAAFFRTETEFFEKITSISGLLKPSQSKDEKKALIRQSLMEYNKEIPECVYLPTNQTHRVVGIVTSSGMPMQSAARVPILVSFEVEDYPGPDNDPILQRQDLLASVIQNSLQRRKFEGPQILEQVWTVIQSQSNKQNGRFSQNLFSPKGTANEVTSPTEIMRRQKPFLLTSASPNPDNKRGRINSQASDVGSIAFEDFTISKLQVGAYQMHPNFKRINGQKRGSIQQTLSLDANQAEMMRKLQEEYNERQTHKDLIMKSYFESGVSKRENEMLTLAIKYVENLQEIKPDGIRESQLTTFRKAKKQINIAAQREQQVPSTKVISCIFKANDDLRQDILALQVIKLFQKIFKQCDLDLYVCPYNCISNRTGDIHLLGGIIEVIPNSYSRDQLGKAFELDLYKYFLKRYGSETSEEFRFARLNFVKSLAAYCVVSYILQIKDRHNGNIMIDESGHLIHIDFGFIFDWSPGKDMRFERSNFKLTQEFVDIMGGYRSEAFNLFVTRVVQGFLAVRRYSEEFVNLTELMHYSGFPCFKPPSLTNLEWRFRKDLDDFQAATYMKGLIEHARTTWTTVIYDLVQYKQNKIVF